ncbi:uncharacterized protein LOC116663321 [Camelus ferus]|uniref:Uncharacterized protein LOC116663321 n=1 Tax=Camelus ferus TaxID=419612 RepID=A0A8B8SY63_CAMFR|nr:uncharacterized protein LOC116663321 [Camelus ferus]XP_032334785.1 uncharacterized protein LOC116663321 [Camelus ferus]XP_032334787.1 uncharacterized protein LOC116663321 [Camelus ferus]
MPWGLRAATRHGLCKAKSSLWASVDSASLSECKGPGLCPLARPWCKRVGREGKPQGPPGLTLSVGVIVGVHTSLLRRGRGTQAKSQNPARGPTHETRGRGAADWEKGQERWCPGVSITAGLRAHLPSPRVQGPPILQGGRQPCGKGPPCWSWRVTEAHQWNLWGFRNSWPLGVGEGLPSIRAQPTRLLLNQHQEASGKKGSEAPTAKTRHRGRVQGVQPGEGGPGGMRLGWSRLVGQEPGRLPQHDAVGTGMQAGSQPPARWVHSTGAGAQGEVRGGVLRPRDAAPSEETARTVRRGSKQQPARSTKRGCRTPGRGRGRGGDWPDHPGSSSHVHMGT